MNLRLKLLSNHWCCHPKKKVIKEEALDESFILSLILVPVNTIKPEPLLKNQEWEIMMFNCDVYNKTWLQNKFAVLDRENVISKLLSTKDM